MQPYLLITLICALLHAIGQAMQKHGMATRLPQVTLRQMLSRLDVFLGAMFKNWLWVLGLVINLLGGILSFQALSMGDVTVVKPLEKLQIVFMVLIGVVLLREHMRRNEWIGVGVICCAAVFIVAGAGAANEWVPDTATNLAVGGFAGALVVGLFAVSHRWPRHITRELALAFGAGSLFGYGDLMVKAATGIAKRSTGSFNVLEGASLSAMLWTPEFAMVILANLIAFVLVQTAFANGRLSLIAPLLGISSTLFPALIGFAVFREDPHPLRLAGIALMLLGTVLLMLRGGSVIAAVLPPATSPRT